MPTTDTGGDTADIEPVHEEPAAAWSASVPARVGLLGNPSDGYGGRVLAMTVPELQTRVHLRTTAEWEFADTPLLEATVEGLRSRRAELVGEPAAFGFSTSIPRQVGLSGSSAIIMAALRALGDRAEHRWDLVELARITLEVETEILGWSAGPQDRVVQAYGGLVDMNFAEPWHAPAYQRLAPTGLPALFVAWDRSGGSPSDLAHSDVKQRWANGDRVIRLAMVRFAELAAEGRATLDRGTADRDWPPLMREAFELRSRFWPITERDRILIDTAGQVGAGAAFAGSGGSVVGALDEPGRLLAAEAAFGELGAGFLVLHDPRYPDRRA